MATHHQVHVRDARRRPRRAGWTPTNPFEPADGGSAWAELDDPLARDTAVEEARAVLEAGWPRWVAERGLDPVPALQCAAPRVTLVGEHPESYHLVALIRFTFTAAGLPYRGYARGPLEAPFFAVQRIHGPGELSGPAARRRWWRRAR